MFSSSSSLSLVVDCNEDVSSKTALHSQDYLKMGLMTMVYNDNSTCSLNCSGHGDCYNGTCFCEVEYTGGACNDPNLKYFIAFSTIFYVICAISFVQLVLCINSEFSRQKPRSILRALKITTQKALYFFICVATAIRGYYFSSPHNVTLQWSESLMSAFYPVLLSGSSLVVCFWAEVFHLHDVSVESPGFLSKSFTGFVLFNVLTYSLLLAELVLFTFANPTETDRSLFTSVFNSLYAILMLVVVIFFLIYGVEVYFKVRGAFTREESWPPDASQLHQSRLGLVSQAILLLITVLFIFSEVLGSFWKDKVPVFSRNYHQIMFRIIEIGTALWFPCVLWNCVRPERLWILNPRRILKKDSFREVDSSVQEMGIREVEALVDSSLMKSERSLVTRSIPECWICYDSDKKDGGPLIRPCACKGDVSAVHHDCLKKWLMESYTNPENIRCKVCDELYQVERGAVWLPSGLTISHWFKTVAILSIMCSAAAGTCLIIKIFDHIYVKTISVGCAIIAEYICLRFLGFNLLSAYHRAKFSAIKIIGQKIPGTSFATSTTKAMATTQSQTSSNSYDCLSGQKGKTKEIESDKIEVKSEKDLNLILD